MALPPASKIYGPMLIGVFFNMILFGILIMQMLTYYTNYRGDRLWMKLFVAYLFILEAANTGFNMHVIYEPLILRYGTEAAYKFFPTFFITDPIIIALVSAPIQLFFAWRIKTITRSIWIPIVITILSFASLAGALWTAIQLGTTVKLFKNKADLHWSALTWFLTASIADVLITGTLVRSLSQRKTGFVATDTVIDKIIRMTVQTGAITALFAIGDVVFFMTIPGTYNFLWDLSLTKLYAICLMSTLNARQNLNDDMSQVPSQGKRNLTVDSNRRADASFLEAGAHSLHYSPASPKTPNYELGSFEAGVKVTKVVERLDDSSPTSRKSEWGYQ